jgi:hypothetical protein
MNETMNTNEVLRSVLKSQYHAALAMLLETIERCPDDSWASGQHANACWQLAYHTLFFTHLYLHENNAAFQPWEQHQANVQHPDGMTGPADPNSTLPLLPQPYSKAQVLAYWSVCDRMVDKAMDSLNLNSQESGFSWYSVSKLEHQIINIRHIQHGAAQLADRLRASAHIGIKWVGSRK